MGLVEVLQMGLDAAKRHLRKRDETGKMYSHDMVQASLARSPLEGPADLLSLAPWHVFWVLIPFMMTMTSTVTWTTSHTWVLKPIYVRSLCSVYDIILPNIDLHMCVRMSGPNRSKRLEWSPRGSSHPGSFVTTFFAAPRGWGDFFGSEGSVFWWFGASSRPPTKLTLGWFVDRTIRSAQGNAVNVIACTWKTLGVTWRDHLLVAVGFSEIRKPHNPIV